MVQLKTLITLYFTFTLRFLSFILGQTSQGTVIFFLFPVTQGTHWCCSSATSPLTKVQEHFPHCSPCSVKQQNIILFWLQITPGGALSKSPSKSTSAATETQFSSATPKRSTDLYFPNQTPLPNNNDPLEHSLFSSFLLQCKRIFFIKKESD